MTSIFNFHRIFLIMLIILSGLVLGSIHSAQAQIQNCPLDIIKSADPADNTPFVIVLGGNAIIPEVTLQVPADPADQINVPSQTAGVTLKEDVPAGWQLVDISCEGDLGFSFNVLPDDTVVASCEVIGNAPPSGQCTFTNVKVAQIVPTLSQWGIIATVGVLGIAGLIAYRRKIVAA